MNNIVDDWSEYVDGDESKDLEETLENFAFKHAVEPPPHAADRIFAKIEALFKASKSRQPLSPDNLPLLDSSSNFMDWSDLVKDIQPPDDYEVAHIHNLVTKDNNELSVAWLKTRAEEDGHFDFEESFLILEGSCVCEMTDSGGKTETISLSAGDYFVVPMGVHHTMNVTSLSPVKAVFQRKALRA